MNFDQRYDTFKQLAIARTGTTSRPAAVYLAMLCSERRVLMNLLRAIGAVSSVLGLVFLRANPVLALFAIPVSVLLVWFGMGQADLMADIMARIKSDSDFS